MTDLKPCPFCGSNASPDDCASRDGLTRLHWVECRGGECGISGRIFDNPEDAAAFWNRRTAGVPACPGCRDCKPWWNWMRITSPPPCGNPGVMASDAARVQRLRDALEGECAGLSIDEHHARAVLEYVDGAVGINGLTEAETSATASVMGIVGVTGPQGEQR